ncbi:MULTISPECIES: DUF1450 domain-containing protein [Halostella]|uniref:DUF1450 domain-containing protein n=1 Tax=Halostella TaxID=1843185 RepID=UPI0010817A45|nr:MULTISPECIES: DUF1450 domain-containing protein [Halostella]
MIEYCLNNVDERTRRLLTDRDDTREASCLDHCGRCYRDSFLVVDGTVETGSDHEAILDQR